MTRMTIPKGQVEDLAMRLDINFLFAKHLMEKNLLLGDSIVDYTNNSDILTFELEHGKMNIFFDDR